MGDDQVITLDMGLLVAGTKYRGEFEERLKKLMEEIKQSDEIILFIDEVHTLIGAGAAEGAIDAANILKPALARGELQVRFLTCSMSFLGISMRTVKSTLNLVFNHYLDLNPSWYTKVFLM